jgi:hypothetical protein
MEGRSFPRAFERRENVLYLGKNFTRNLRDMYKKKRPCKRAALSVGALLGKLEGVNFTGTSERKRKCISAFLF